MGGSGYGCGGEGGGIGEGNGLGPGGMGSGSGSGLGVVTHAICIIIIISVNGLMTEQKIARGHTSGCGPGLLCLLNISLLRASMGLDRLQSFVQSFLVSLEPSPQVELWHVLATAGLAVSSEPWRYSF